MSPINFVYFSHILKRGCNFPFGPDGYFAQSYTIISRLGSIESNGIFLWLLMSRESLFADHGSQVIRVRVWVRVRIRSHSPL